MKLEYLPEYLTITVASILGMGLAFYIGIWTGGGNSQTPIIIVGGIVALSIALILRAHIWILIPLFWPFTGLIAGTPGEIPTRDLVILYVFPVFLALKALKVVRSKTHYGWLDYLLLLNLLYLGTVYIRNPVGTYSMGFERAGGRPYFEAIFALLGFWVIGHVTMPAKLAVKMPWFCAMPSLAVSAGSFISAHIPAASPILGHIYSEMGGAAPGEGEGPSADSIEIERPGYLGGAGSTLTRVLYSVFPPFTTVNPLYFWRFLLASLSLYAILKAGFRSGLIGTVLFFMFAAYFRYGITALFRLAFVCVPMLGFIAFAQGNVVDLPYSIQRTLSFLPGKWTPEVVADAQSSSEWRFQIWQNVCDPHNKYIVNWWLGDGFGITKTQLIESALGHDVQEALTVSGDYHSLPLSAVHTVGFIGTGFLVVLMFGMAYYGWNLILRAEGTPFFAVALYFGVPIIAAPMLGFFVFGAYKGQIVECIFGVAMLRMISRSLIQYQIETNPPLPGKIFPEVEMNRYPQRALT
jgi:hypothetical protein